MYVCMYNIFAGCMLMEHVACWQRLPNFNMTCTIKLPLKYYILFWHYYIKIHYILM